MLALASHETERLADFHLRANARYQHGILHMEHIEDFRTAHPLRLLFFLWHSETSLEHRLQVIRLKERKIVLLQTNHIVIGEPITRLLIPQLIHNLCIELVVIDDRNVVYITTGWDVDTDVSATSRRVAERMLVVGGCQEGGITRTISLRLAEDGTAVHLHLGECLLQLSLLVRSHVGELIYVDIEVVGESHLAVKLVGEVDVVEEVLAQMLRQEAVGKSTLATPLLTDEHRHHLVAVQRVHRLHSSCRPTWAIHADRP